jgi:hypothetical protein
LATIFLKLKTKGGGEKGKATFQNGKNGSQGKVIGNGRERPFLDS